MSARTLTISIEPDMDVYMMQFAERAENGLVSRQYQGEYLNFPTPAQFFSRITAHRWNMVACLLGQGAVSVRELAQRLGCEIKQIHEDAKVLVELGVLEKTVHGTLVCPYERIHFDMTVMPLAKAA